MIKSVDFGYIFSRVCREYGYSPREVLDLPARTFWLLHRNIDRLNAEADLRTAAIMRHAVGGEGFDKLIETLRKRLGKVIDYDEGKLAVSEAEAQYDREGLLSLKAMSRAV